MPPPHTVGALLVAALVGGAFYKKKSMTASQHAVAREGQAQGGVTLYDSESQKI